MAKKPTPHDVAIQQLLRAQNDSLRNTLTNQRVDREMGVDNYVDNMVGNWLTEDFNRGQQETADRARAAQDRTVGEHVQDAGAGMMGTFGSIGSTIGTIGAAGIDAVGNIDNMFTGEDAEWDLTAGALENANSVSEYWQSLKSQKSQAFQRVGAYRQERAAQTRQAEAEAAGETVGTGNRLWGEFATAVGHYGTNPGQIVSEGIAQLPYLLTGGLAKGATAGSTAIAGAAAATTSRAAAPLINRLVATGMSPEAALKAVQAGLVGVQQGVLEGADAGAGAYAGAIEAGASQNSAVAAAAEAAAITAPLAALTGAVASKWDLQPFASRGATLAAKTGNNLADAIYEGVQEVVESGIGTLATNKAIQDQADPTQDLLEGLGEAAGTGFVVGAGSVGVTRPTAIPTAALALGKAAVSPIGKAFEVAGDKLADTQETEAQAVVQAATNDQVTKIRQAAGIAPVLTEEAVLASPEEDDTVEVAIPGTGITMTVGKYAVPEGVDRSDPVSLYLTGLDYLNRTVGKEGAEEAPTLHVLTDVINSMQQLQPIISNLMDRADDESLPDTERAAALTAADSLADRTDIAKFEEIFKTLTPEKIDSWIMAAALSPEKMATVVSGLVGMNPFSVSQETLDQAALHSKKMPEAQRKAIEQAVLVRKTLSNVPTNSEVRESIMQTGFPGGGNRKSVQEMISDVTAAMTAGKEEDAQIYFNKLLAFSAYMTEKAELFRKAKTKLAKNPNLKSVKIEGVGTWVDPGNGQPAEYQYGTPFVLHQNENSLKVPELVASDAKTIEDLVQGLNDSNPVLVQKRITKKIAKNVRKDKAKAKKKASANEKNAEAQAKAAAEKAAREQAPEKPQEPASVSKPVATLTKVDESPAPSGEAGKPKLTRVDDDGDAKPVGAKPALTRVDDGAPATKAEAKPEGKKADVIKMRPDGVQIITNQGGKEKYDKLRELAELTEDEQKTLDAGGSVVTDYGTFYTKEIDGKKIQVVGLDAEGRRRANEAIGKIGPKPEPVPEGTNQFSNSLVPGNQQKFEQAKTKAERDNHTNHLAESFTRSKKEGLLSKGLKRLRDPVTRLTELFGDRQVSKEEKVAAGWITEMRKDLLDKLNEGISKAFPKATLARILEGKDFPTERRFMSLQAAQYDENGVEYHPEIAEIMVWTGIQQMMEMVNPIDWSSEALKDFQSMYGDEIHYMLAEGYVPENDIVKKIAHKLRTNLELKADPSVSKKYTDGLLLVMAKDIMVTMYFDDNEIGAVNMRQMPILKMDENGNMSPSDVKTNFVSIDPQDKDISRTAAKIFKNFFPERSGNIAYTIGEPTKTLNKQYRNTNQEIGDKQLKGLRRMSDTKHTVSSVMVHLMEKLTPLQLMKLNGFDDMEDIRLRDKDMRDLTLHEKEIKGKNSTIMSDLTVVSDYYDSVKEYAAANNLDVHDVATYNEYEMVVNGRAMTKGTSQQSSKFFREFAPSVDYQLDTKNPEMMDRFMMAVAQGFGAKMDKRKISENLASMRASLEDPRTQDAIAAARAIIEGVEGEIADSTLEALRGAVFNGKQIELSAHALSALMHLAALEIAYENGTPMRSSLSFEIDGMTDGPINLMMLLGMDGNVEGMEKWLLLAGLIFGDENPRVIQDNLDEVEAQFGNGIKDFYGVIAKAANEKLLARRKALLHHYRKSKLELDAVKEIMEAVEYLMAVTGVIDDSIEEPTYTRDAVKKSTQASGYLQGPASINNDLSDKMLKKLSELLHQDDGSGEIFTVGMHQAMGVLMNNTLKVESDLYGNITVMGKKKVEIWDAATHYRWDGKALQGAQLGIWKRSLRGYGGSGISAGTMTVLHRQRTHLESLTKLANVRVAYANKKMQEAYRAKQAEEVKAGNLFPGMPLSKTHEDQILKDVLGRYLPGPMLRFTKGIPLAFTSQYGDENRDEIESVVSALDPYKKPMPVGVANLDDPGVSFAAKSIMGSGDGAMMVGYFNSSDINALNMYDGIYISPEDIDETGRVINHEVKANWLYDFIGASLEAFNLDDPDFSNFLGTEEAASVLGAPDGMSSIEYSSTIRLELEEQRQTQVRMWGEINKRQHYVSHMAGHNSPAVHTPGETTYSDTTPPPVPKPRPKKVASVEAALEGVGSYDTSGVQVLNSTQILEIMRKLKFENPILHKIWTKLSKVMDPNAVMYISSDAVAVGNLYKSITGLTYGDGTNGVSINGNIFISDLNPETLVHELLHHSLRNLSATFYSNIPGALTKAQNDAMRDMDALMQEFLKATFQNPKTQFVQSIVQEYLDAGRKNDAFQEFLAYGLSDGQVQMELGTTKTKKPLRERLVAAIKKAFGLADGTLDDSMLVRMLSNYEKLTLESFTAPQEISPSTALFAVNPKLALSFSPVLEAFYQRSTQMGPSINTASVVRSKRIAKQRMNQLGNTGLFNLAPTHQTAAEYMQAIFFTGLQMKPDVNAVLQRVVDAVKTAGVDVWRTNDDPTDTVDIDLAKARRAFFFDDANSGQYDLAADILSLSLVEPAFNERLSKLRLTNVKVDKSSTNNVLTSMSQKLFEAADTKLDIREGTPLDQTLEVLANRIRKTALDSVKRSYAKPSKFKQATEKASALVHLTGDVAARKAQALAQKGGKASITERLLWVLAGATNTTHADMVGKLVLSLTNELEGASTLREIIQQDLVGTVSSNEKLVMLKGKAARNISALRESFVEQVPLAVQKWFTKPLTPMQDEAMHRIIGQFGFHTLGQDMMDRIEELLQSPQVAGKPSDAINDAIMDSVHVLMSGGDGAKRSQMITHAKKLGDFMAGASTDMVYKNTGEITKLMFHGGAKKLKPQEVQALEAISTLQAMTHLNARQRAAALDLVRNERDGWNKAVAFIGTMSTIDSSRGNNTTRMNTIKGYIPTKTDPRKRVRLVEIDKVAEAERLGWEVAEPYVVNGVKSNKLVYMSTTVGKMPPLSGGAIHAVDPMMNGIHYKSGMSVMPGIQTLVTDAAAVAKITKAIESNQQVPYLPVLGSRGQVSGYQRILDPRVVERHTKSVYSLSTAAGSWLGRIHEEIEASEINQTVADLLVDTMDEAKKDGTFDKEFVDITNTTDKTWGEVWRTMPYNTKVMLENKFNPGAKPGEPKPVWIRKDQILDAIGHHKATVGDIFHGTHDRWSDDTRRRMAAFATELLGKNAYKYLTRVEDGWFGAVAVAKDTIIVKSLEVAFVNGMSNQYQLWAVTGNPIWNLRVQAQKHKEALLYLRYQKRISQLYADAYSDPTRESERMSEINQLQKAQSKLSIHPLIVAGEFPTIAEGKSEIDEFSLAADATEWFEKQVGKMPDGIRTVMDYAAISKNTALYQGLDSLVQLGDFVAKAAMYEYLTQTQKMDPGEAMAKVNDEFVNYSRLAGRTRTYLENAGMMWFYNYKLRILKIILRRMRENPVNFLISQTVGELAGAETLIDSLPFNVNYGYSLGPGQLIDSPNAILWNQLTPDF